MHKNVIRGLAGIVAVTGIGLMSVTATGQPGGPSKVISFMPQNDLSQQDNLLAPTGITQDQFNAVIAAAKTVYDPIVSKLGGQLVINALWTNDTVNANASRSGTTWTVNMYGGLARRAEVTTDGFGVVLCHEIGHHVGGYFFYSGTDWAAAEGQSDWYATQACARRLWAADTAKNAEFRNTAPQVLKDKCDNEWATTEQQDLCYRVGMAGKSAADLLGALQGTTVSFTTPDTTVVTRTNTAHPAAQCRLDTYLTGALCTVQADLNTIPGLNAAGGRNSAEAERDAARTRCLPASAAAGTPGYNGQNVPTCWFKPQVSGFTID